MVFGTMFLGRVQSLEGQAIVTKFFVVGGPLVPLQSLFATETGSDGLKGVPLDTVVGRSAVAGYLRVWSAYALLVSVILMVADSWSRTTYLAWAVASALVLGLANFWLGRLSPEERARRQRLLEVTGLAIPPALLPAGTRQDLLAVLERRWGERSPRQAWREAIARPPEGAADRDLLFALAEYDLVPALAKGL